MAAANSDSPGSADQTLVITRVLDAPPGLVFKAWTEAEHVRRWWGPKGFETTSCKLDVRPGGQWRICMRSPEGKERWVQGVYREIVERKRLVFTWAWEKPEGTPGRETLVTIDFAEHGAKTKLTFRQAQFETVLDRDEHEDGWSESFDRLAEYVAKA
jgi:uncharacterized protein YndB with AHSA1/START domain